MVVLTRSNARVVEVTQTKAANLSGGCLQVVFRVETLFGGL